MSILRTTFLYFSRFVPRPALAAPFMLSSHPGHADLKEETLTLPDDRRIEGINDFIFSIDQNGVQQRISNVKGTFLFVDYSSVTSTVDRVDVKKDRFHVAITVARPRPKDQDQATEMLWQDEMLDIITAIRRVIRHDEDLKRSVWWLDFPTTISPWNAPSLGNSTGWTMEFDITGIDIV